MAKELDQAIMEGIKASDLKDHLIQHAAPYWDFELYQDDHNGRDFKLVLTFDEDNGDFYETYYAAESKNRASEWEEVEASTEGLRAKSAEIRTMFLEVLRGVHDHCASVSEVPFCSRMEAEINELRGQGDAAATAVAEYLADVGNSFIGDNPEASDQEVHAFMKGCLGDLVDQATSLSVLECPPTKLVIDIEGGIANERVSSRPVEILFIDDDTEGAAPEDLNTVTGKAAYVTLRVADVDSGQARDLFNEANGDIEAKQHIVDERDECLKEIRAVLKELPEKELLGMHSKWCRQTYTATGGEGMRCYSNGQGSSCCRGSLESSIAYAAEMKGLEHVRQLHAELGLSDDEESMVPSFG